MSPGVKARKTRERLIAVGLTFSAYGAILFFLTRPSAIPTSATFDNGGDVAVTLLGTGMLLTSNAQAADPAEALAQALAQGSMSEMRVPPARQMSTNLSDLFGEAPKASSAASSAATAAPAGGVVRTGLVGDPGAQISGGRRNVSVGPDGQILPCWRQPEQRVAVKISIILDQQGGLIGPPEIVRSRTVPNDAAQRAAEAIAMRAMAGCAPFSLASAAGKYRSFELDFSKDRNWIQPTGLIDVR